MAESPAKTDKPADPPSPAELRDRILEAALPHIPFDGWSRKALLAGARDAGYGTDEVARVFSGSAAEMIELHSTMADHRMAAALEEVDLAAMRIRDRIKTVIMVRLEQNAADREAIRRALAVLALPQNGPLAARLLYRTVDAMWHATGDTATDFSFYSKRGLLAGVYSSTLLYWLNDNSDGFEDTRAFVDRRIANIMGLPKVSERLRGAMRGLPNPVRLMRGIGRRRRTFGPGMSRF